MYELKKFGSKSEGTGPSSNEERIYRAAVDDFKLEDVDSFMYLGSVVNSENEM